MKRMRPLGVATLLCLLLLGLAEVDVCRAESGGSGAALLLGAFGGTTKQGESLNSTYGMFYEYRTGFFSGSLALGALYDMIQDLDAKRLVLVINSYLSTDFHVGLGAGVRSAAGETRNLYHLEAGYSFHSEALQLMPVFAFESVSGENNMIYGLRFLLGI